MFKLIIISSILSASSSYALDPFEDISLNSRLGFLHSYNPNYLSYATPLESNDRGDLSHAEFYVSIQTPTLEINSNSPYIPNRMKVVYNGLYDFYVDFITPGDSGIYDSGPVVSKRQNIGGLIEWDLKSTSNISVKQFQLGLWHESNGQTLDNAATFNRLRNTRSEEFALSQTSRGWDYISLGFEYQPYRFDPKNRRDETWRRFKTELRTYFGSREESIFWEPLVEQPKIIDYDGLRFTYEQEIKRPLFFKNKPQLFKIDLKTGISDFEALTKIGGKLSYSIFINGGTYLNFSYFNGYGKDVSTYHQRRKYLSIGLEFR